MRRSRRWSRILVATLAVAVVVPGGAPGVGLRAQSPAAGSGLATQADSLTTMYVVDGVRVIHRLATTSDIVFAGLYLLGGVRQVTPETAGIELLLLETSERGTRSYPRDRLRQTMARLGTSITTRITADWTSLAVRATTTTFDSTWHVLASRVMEPQLDSAEFEIIRGQILTAVRQRQDSPDALVEFLADSFAFDGHPYALTPAGTEASLSALTLADLRRYHREQFVKSRMLLVVVGNVPRARIEALVRTTIARLPQGDYVWTLPDPLPRESADVLTVHRALPTNYILGRFPGPRADSPDYQALRITTAILSGQLFSEIRSRRNLTYAVEAPFVERAVAVGGLYVTTVQPEVTLQVMHQQIQALRNGTVNEHALEQLIQQFTTHYFLDNESAADQADFLARAYLFTGDYRRAMRFEDELRAVRPADIRRVAQRYLRDVQFVFLGDTSRAPVSVMRRY